MLKKVPRFFLAKIEIALKFLWLVIVINEPWQTI